MVLDEALSTRKHSLSYIDRNSPKFPDRYHHVRAFKFTKHILRILYIALLAWDTIHARTCAGLGVTVHQFSGSKSNFSPQIRSKIFASPSTPPPQRHPLVMDGLLPQTPCRPGRPRKYATKADRLAAQRERYSAQK